MKFAKIVLMAAALVLISNTTAFAQGAGNLTGTEQGVVAKKANWGIAMGAGIGAGLIVIGGGYGISTIAARSVESMARQPEVAGTINGAMIVSAALIEGLGFGGVLVCLLIIFMA